QECRQSAQEDLCVGEALDGVGGISPHRVVDRPVRRNTQEKKENEEYDEPTPAAEAVRNVTPVLEGRVEQTQVRQNDDNRQEVIVEHDRPGYQKPIRPLEDYTRDQRPHDPKENRFSPSSGVPARSETQ